jgi:hypothetical protein
MDRGRRGNTPSANRVQADRKGFTAVLTEAAWTNEFSRKRSVNFKDFNEYVEERALDKLRRLCISNKAY